jgi:hypothetical protein
LGQAFEKYVQIHHTNYKRLVIDCKFIVNNMIIREGELKYIPFDVYHHCGHKNYDKLSLLVDQIREDMKKFMYFRADIPKKTSNNPSNAAIVFKKQEGVFRTNCKDCLDRTNLVQVYNMFILS